MKTSTISQIPLSLTLTLKGRVALFHTLELSAALVA